MERYDLNALLDLWRDRRPEHQPKDCGCTIGGSCASIESFARCVQVSHSTMHRRISHQYLSALEADKWACMTGVLPHDIWPEWGRALRESEQVIL